MSIPVKGSTLVNMRGSEAPGDLWCVTHLAGMALEELFIPPALERLERMALYKIICVLRRPAHPEYSVAGTGESIAELAFHVRDHTSKWHGFVAMHDLPMPFRGYTGKLGKEVLADARIMLLLHAVAGIPEHQLWYHGGLGYWQAAQSLIDQYRPLQREVWRLPAPKATQAFKDSSWHGRPRRDRNNGTVEGTSIGRGRYSQLR